MGMKKWRDLPEAQGLYDPRNEHDACGIGFVANIRGERSYGIVDDALKILENLKHRGGEGADHKSGDGAGILTQIPHDFFHRECEVLGFSLPPEGEYGVGMIFAHRYEDFRKEQMRVFEEIVKEEGQTVLGWREVPIDESIIGEAARSIRPRFLQESIAPGSDGFRAQALHHPAARGEEDHSALGRHGDGFLYRQPVLAHDRVQGDADE